MTSFIKSAKFSKDTKKHSPHYHDCHQIIFIKKGNIEITINGDVKKASKGDVIIVSRFENHSIKILSSQYERYILRTNNNLPTEDKVFSVFTNRPQNFSNIISTASLENDFDYIFKKIVTEFSNDDNFHLQLGNLLLNQLLIYICRLLPEKFNNFNDQGFNLTYSLQQEFEYNYSCSYNLKSLAEKYNVSVSTLSHNFKKIVGVSVFDYLLSCRMAAAKKYLTKTNLSIGEIVEKCGFTDNSNFSRTFKKLNGISPLDFRNQFKT